MAATGRMASKKGEASAFEEGDIYGTAIGGEEEEDYARALADFDRESAEAKRVRQQQAYMKQRQAKKLAEEAEYRRLKELGLLGVQTGPTTDSDAELKRKRMNKQMAEEEKARLREELEKAKRERQERAKWLKSAEYKRQQWEAKQEEGRKYLEEWEKKEDVHKEKAAQHQSIKEQWERQKKVDTKYTQQQSEGASAAAGATTPQPKPKAGNKAGGKKGGGGKKVDLSRFGAGVVLPQKVKEQEQKEMEEITYDPARDKDPARPEEEKKEDLKTWERTEREWKKYIEEWLKLKEEHRKELERLKSTGFQPETEEEGAEKPVFEDESASESESESESESSEDDDWSDSD